MTIIAEELGRASFDVAMCYIASVIAALTVSRHASSEQRAELVPDLVAGPDDSQSRYPSPMPAATLRRSAPTPKTEAITSWSTARRCGAPGPGCPTLS